MTRSRRQFTTPQKLALARRHLVDKTPVSGLEITSLDCIRHRYIPGITPTQGTAARVFSASACPVLEPTDTTGIEALIQRLAAKDLTFAPNREVVEQYHYRVVGKQLAQRMETAMRQADHGR